LIVHSPSGYKRIVVGEGHMAKRLSESTRPSQPRTAYLDQLEEPSRCYSPPFLWKGRGRMYGLPDHVVPTPPVYCD
jgi:hypothetical protein